MVTVNIANEGISIPAAEMDAVFRRGYRCERAKNKYPAGTGFGLYIAQKIVELHEGTLSVGTDDRGRTVFSVTLHVNRLAGKAKQWPKKPSS